MTDLMERLDEMARRSRERADVPTLDAVIARSGRHHHTRRRNAVLVAAAVVAAVAIVGGLLASKSSRHTNLTTTDQLHGEGPHLVPTIWPAGLDGPTVATTRHPWDLRPLPAWILAHDGSAAVTASIEGHPMQPPPVPNEPPRVEKPIIAGSTGWALGGWAWTDGDDERVEVAIHPGWTLGLSSRVVDRATLEQLAAAFDPASDRFSTRDLPAGWTLVPDPATLAPVVLGEVSSGPGWDKAVRTDDGGPAPTSLSVISRRTADAARFVTASRQLDGAAYVSPASIPGSIDIGLGGVIRARGDGAWFVVWAQSSDVLAVAWATGVGHDDLLAALRSVRPASAESWARMQPAAPRVTDGFALGSEEQVIDSGSVDRWKWMVTTEPAHLETLPSDFPVPEAERPKLVFNLYVRSEDGSQHNVGGGTLSVGSTASGRDDQIAGLQFGIPLGVHDVRIHYAGRVIPTVTVPIPAMDVTLVFGVMPGRDTATVDIAQAALSGTRPDGSPYNPAMPNGG